MNTHPDGNVSIFDLSRRTSRPPGTAANRLVLIVPTLEMPRHHPDALFVAMRMIQELDPDERVHLGGHGEPSHVENRYLKTLRRSYRGTLGFQFSSGLNLGKYYIPSLPPTYGLEVNWIAVDGPGEAALRGAIESGRSVVMAAGLTAASVGWRDGDMWANRVAKEAAL